MEDDVEDEADSDGDEEEMGPDAQPPQLGVPPPGATSSLESSGPSTSADRSSTDTGLPKKKLSLSTKRAKLA